MASLENNDVSLFLVQQELTESPVDGTQLFYSSVTAPSHETLVLLCHGLGEHVGRYTDVLKYWWDLKCDVFALDHRGHGNSGGKRGHILAFEEYLDDFDHIRLLAIKGKTYRKVVVLGHSMGGVIALRYVQEHLMDVDALIVTGQTLFPVLEVPWWKLLLGKILNIIYPAASFANGIQPEDVCGNRDIQLKYASDPLVHGWVTARWYSEFTKNQEVALQHLPSITIPVIWMVGHQDVFCTPEHAKACIDMLGSPVQEKRLIMYTGMRHEILFETERQEVFKDLTSWCNEFDLTMRAVQHISYRNISQQRL